MREVINNMQHLKVWQNKKDNFLHRDVEDAIFHAKLNVSGSTSKFSNVKVEYVGTTMINVTFSEGDVYKSEWIQEEVVR